MYVLCTRVVLCFLQITAAHMLLFMFYSNMFVFNQQNKLGRPLSRLGVLKKIKKFDSKWVEQFSPFHRMSGDTPKKFSPPAKPEQPALASSKMAQTPL